MVDELQQEIERLAKERKDEDAEIELYEQIDLTNETNRVL